MTSRVALGKPYSTPGRAKELAKGRTPLQIASPALNSSTFFSDMSAGNSPSSQPVVAKMSVKAAVAGAF